MQGTVSLHLMANINEGFSYIELVFPASSTIFLTVQNQHEGQFHTQTEPMGSVVNPTRVADGADMATILEDPRSIGVSRPKRD